MVLVHVSFLLWVLESSLSQDPFIESQESGKKTYTQGEKETLTYSYMEEDIRLNYIGKTVITNRGHVMGWRKVKEIRLVLVFLSNFGK